MGITNEQKKYLKGMSCKIKACVGIKAETKEFGSDIDIDAYNEYISNDPVSSWKAGDKVTIQVNGEEYEYVVEEITPLGDGYYHTILAAVDNA